MSLLMLLTACLHDNRAVGAAASAMTGGGGEAAPQQQYEQQQPQQFQREAATACSVDQQNLMACLNQNQGNVEACQFFFEALTSCQRSGAQQFA